jgi:hypothetical protein
MFSIHQQYVDLRSGMHVVEMRDGDDRHFVQIAIGHDKCIACGRVHPKDNVDQLDPRALVAEVNAALDKSHEQMREYAKKHNLTIR